MLDVAPNARDGPVRVLDNVSAGERAARFSRKGKANDGEDSVEALRDAAGHAKGVVFQSSAKIVDLPRDLIVIAHISDLSQCGVDANG